MIIAANFKTNHTRKSTQAYLETLAVHIQTSHIKDEIRVFIPPTAFSNPKLPLHVKLGAQNFYPVDSGSFTGEIGAQQLDEFNTNSVLIGHSERRHILKEENGLILKKFDFAKDKNWEITYCIGEPKSIRDKGEKAVLDYLDMQLQGIDLNYKQLIIAYEPVWAIGTGDTANNEDIDSILNTLRKTLQAPLLYGGSVKAENAKEIFGLENCDGVLVGTASWDVENFIKIINQAKQ